MCRVCRSVMCDCHSCSVCVTVWYPMVVCNLVCVLQDWTQWEALGPGLCVCACVNLVCTTVISGLHHCPRLKRRPVCETYKLLGKNWTQWKRPRKKFVYNVQRKGIQDLMYKLCPQKRRSYQLLCEHVWNLQVTVDA